PRAARRALRPAGGHRPGGRRLAVPAGDRAQLRSRVPAPGAAVPGRDPPAVPRPRAALRGAGARRGARGVTMATSEPPRTKKRARRAYLLLIGLAGGALAIYLVHGCLTRDEVKTDDAQVDADVVPIA